MGITRNNAVLQLNQYHDAHQELTPEDLTPPRAVNGHSDTTGKPIALHVHFRSNLKSNFSIVDSTASDGRLYMPPRSRRTSSARGTYNIDNHHRFPSGATRESCFRI
jgi:hypothetical protein